MNFYNLDINGDPRWVYWAVEVVLAKSQGGDLLGTIDALAAALNPLAERPE